MPNYKYKPAGAPSAKGNRIIFTVQLHPLASAQVNERAKKYNVSVSHYLWRLIAVGYMAETGQALAADREFQIELRGLSAVRGKFLLPPSESKSDD